MNAKNKKILITVDKEETQRKDIFDILRCRDCVEEVFIKKNTPVETLYLQKNDFRNIDDIENRILAFKPSCIFNLFEGFSDDSEKEAEFVRILEKIGIPFTGNSSFTLSLCLSKWKTKEILKKKKIPVPLGIFIKDIKNLVITANLKFPLFIKPCHEDASVGVDKDSLVYDKEKLYTVTEKKIKEFPKGIIIEEFIGGKEYSVAFMGGIICWPLSVSVMDYIQHKSLPPYLTYDSKWETECEEFKFLEPSLGCLDESTKRKIIFLAKKAAKTLRCRSYFRIDLREREGSFFIIDINPNPDINRDSGFMKQAYDNGYSYEETIERIARLAKVRK